ncbi:MAG: methyltransferase domain-containing protein [Candidatus Thorarchaeota archaeon]
MQEAHLKSLRCPRCQNTLGFSENSQQSSKIVSGTLVCDKGHTWKIKDGIPSLVYPEVTESDQKWIKEYDEMAEKYDELVLQYNEWLGVDLMKEREGFTQFIPIEGPSRILDVSIGTGANFVAISNVFKNKTGRFNLHGLDLSWGMLSVSKRKFVESNLTVNLVHSSVLNIPYVDNFFDIVLHSGGINTFSDIPLAFEELLRVAREGGFIIVVDEGVSPELRSTEKGKAIIEANNLFAAQPPLEHIPLKAKDVEVVYVMNDTFYQISFRK